jgi:carbamoyltransferase
MKDIINYKVKHREPFRPFAGSILIEDVHKYFDVPEKKHESPFMLFVFNVNKNKRKIIPAITHVDNTCRIQTISRAINNTFYDLIKEFKKISGVSVILNTSFNVRGEPIVCSPKEAYNDFINTRMDYLVLNNFFVKK